MNKEQDPDIMVATRFSETGHKAPFAAVFEKGRGRQFPESDCAMRSPFQRDRDRIIHSTSFRRLNHKTQVFLYHEGDHYRSRLTHSLEVAQIARSMARMLHLDEDLTEALALAHDLGHPPFGHEGERALNKMMQDFGGFDHNAQSLKVVTKLEWKYPNFSGLNLSWDCLEGLVKHNGPLPPEELNEEITNFNASFDLAFDQQASLEAQLAAVADDIAYNNHDIDDGLRAGLLQMDQLREVPLTARILDDIDRNPSQLHPRQIIYELNRQLITKMVGDVISETRLNLSKSGAQSVEDIRTSSFTHAKFSSAMSAEIGQLRSLLFDSVYRDQRIMKLLKQAHQVVEDLFAYYMQTPEILPVHWRTPNGEGTEKSQAIRICDFIAGMTDRYAVLEHRRLFDATPDLL